MKLSPKCLGCYEPLMSNILDENYFYHPNCSKKIFGNTSPPIIPFGASDLEKMAKISLQNHLGLTGVQQKISVDLEKYKNESTHRVMIVGLWGKYILKPSSTRFPEMAVVEDLTMHMAKSVSIETAQHGLLKLKSGELAYVTKRFDRGPKKSKKAVEDFCQLSELMTSEKYKTSTEKAGKIILKYSSNSGLDAIRFFEINLFSFLVGNSDMHLKNFSLMRYDSDEIKLSPAYDLLSTKILLPEDQEEMALTINGKKNKLRLSDFKALALSFKIHEKAIEDSFRRYQEAYPIFISLIQKSFLSDKLKKNYLQLIYERFSIFK